MTMLPPMPVLTGDAAIAATVTIIILAAQTESAERNGLEHVTLRLRPNTARLIASILEDRCFPSFSQ